MDWENLLLAFLLLLSSTVVAGILAENIPPKKMFMSDNHNRIYWYGIPLMAVLNNYDELTYVSWGYFIGLSIGVGMMTFFIVVVMNQVTGFVMNLDHNKKG
mgnify:CR=1 FL=1